MAGGYITIFGRKYAADLFWQPAPRGAAREAARKIARATSNRAGRFVAFNGMIGLGSARPGTPVAAAEVMEFIGEGAFLAAFKVREGAWLLAVRGGIIIKDRVFKDVLAAKEEYAELAKMPDWGALIAPADWNAPAAVERLIGSVVSGRGRHKMARISLWAGYLMTWAIVGAALFAGYSFFKRPLKDIAAPPRESEEAEEYQRQLDEMDARLAPHRAAPDEIRVPLPYDDMVGVEARSDQCWRAIAFLYQQLVGWVVDSVECGTGEARARLIRNFGTVDGLRAEVSQKMRGATVEEVGTGEAVLHARLRPLETSRTNPAYDVAEAEAALKSIFQKINADVDVRRDAVRLKLPPLGDNQIYDTDKTEVPAIRAHVELKLSPLEMAPVLKRLGAVEFVLIKWDNRARSWAYDMTVYVR